MIRPVLVFDIDGTLVPHGGIPPDGLADILGELQAAGHQLLVATARRRSSAQHRLGELNRWLDDGVFNNGACTWIGGSLAAAADLDPRACRRIIERMAACSQVTAASIALADEHIAFTRPLSAAEEDLWGVQEHHLVTIESALSSRPIRLCCWTLDGDLTELYEGLCRDEAAACQWQLTDRGRVLFGTAPGVDKASAVQAWCEARQIQAGDVWAFGDDVSDLALLRWAGRGIGMADGHPDVVAFADLVAAPAAEGGLVRVLADLARG